MAAETYTDLPRFTSLVLTRNGREHQVRKAGRAPIASKPGMVIVVDADGISTRANLADLRVA